MKDEEFYNVVADIIKEFEPKTRIRNKEDVWYHKILGKILPSEFSEYSTTTGYSIAMTEKHRGHWGVLGHEGVHVLQSQRQTRLLHGILYLLPQLLVLGFILAPLITWSLSWWFLLFLVFAVPIPAYFRMRKELEAYSASITFRLWRRSYVPEHYYKHYSVKFVEGHYWYMWPFRKYIEKKLREAVGRADVFDGEFLREQPYLTRIRWAMIEHGMFHSKGI